MRKPACAYLNRVLSALVVLMLYVSFVPAYAETGNSVTQKLPIDFSGGFPLQKDGFKPGWEYKDPTIHVKVEKDRTEGCDYWIADVTIADPSQLRTLSAGGFDSTRIMDGWRMAQRVNAVLALDGDFFFFTGKGYIVRQGIEYKNILTGDRDILLIDEEGDFHAILLAEKVRNDGTINGKKIINAFYFGPALVKDGAMIADAHGDDMADNEKRQRMCIAQVGKLHYKVICCAAPARGSNGMTLRQFANLVAKQNVQVAYNLDGGDSTMMIFNGAKINDVTNGSTRKISDIIYFASAYQP